MGAKLTAVPALSRQQGKPEAPSIELIDAEQLARKWNVPVSWVRDRTRGRTPREDRIPCVRLGRYVRFRWPSADLDAWLERHQG
jgi:hypothetical protein